MAIDHPFIFGLGNQQKQHAAHAFNAPGKLVEIVSIHDLFSPISIWRHFATMQRLCIDKKPLFVLKLAQGGI